jgi:membrane-associated protease RseP (regulator of RpoE activity)
MWRRIFPKIAVAAMICFSFALIGCQQNVRPVPETRSVQPPKQSSLGRFEPVVGRGADTVAELRAAPAPSQPEFSEGESAAGDERVVSAKGFVKVADGYYAGIDADANAWLRKRGSEVGADKVIFYNVPPDEATHAPSLHAVYYVRFKLPFGASFRDLKAEERTEIGSSGVRIGTVVGGSPAAEANLRTNDVITKIDGKDIAGRADFEKQLRARMGKRVTLTISRNGTIGTRIVRLGVLASELSK